MCDYKKGISIKVISMHACMYIKHEWIKGKWMEG